MIKEIKKTSVITLKKKRVLGLTEIRIYKLVSKNQKALARKESSLIL